MGETVQGLSLPDQASASPILPQQVFGPADCCSTLTHASPKTHVFQHLLQQSSDENHASGTILSLDQSGLAECKWHVPPSRKHHNPPSPRHAGE